jgi:murein DD-endopeptidase MepM/ murein hydrolase activator NlpD
MFDLKKIKNISIIVVPETTSQKAKSYKFSIKKLFIYSVIYTLVVFFSGFYLISYTPLNEILLPYSLRLTDSDRKKVSVLNEKVEILAKEIENLKSVNKRLKFAILLGDSTLIRDLESEKETTQVKTKFEGNIFAVISKILNHFFNSQNQNLFFIRPSEGFISQKFNPQKGHFGVDYVMNENRPIFASAGGYVVFASYTTEYGYSIIINHKDNYVTKYQHCASLLKREGDFVYQGEIIALSGNSGTESTGPHLHFEIWKDGKPIDPLEILISK